MPTARSWTDPLVDLGHLLRFRAQTVRRPRATAVSSLVLLGLTLASMIVPALVDGAGAAGRAEQARDYLPSLLTGFLILSVVSAVSSGGGRELLPRDQAAIHPISTTTEHLGALALSPLNFAFLVQTWLAAGRDGLHRRRRLADLPAARPVLDRLHHGAGPGARVDVRDRAPR